MARKSRAKKTSSTKKTPSTGKSTTPQAYHLACGSGEKGQGISINTIIIAVLGLIVLVVLIVIFTGQTGKFTKGTTETATVTCSGSWRDNCLAGEQPYYGVTDAAQLRANVGKTCCVTTTTPPTK